MLLIGLEAFWVILSSSTPVSVLKAPQALGKLFCPQEHIGNGTSPSVPLPHQLSTSDVAAGRCISQML